MNLTKPYVVIATVEALPGKERALHDLLSKVVAPSRAEPACLEYRLHQNLSNPAQFILYERWESSDAHVQQFQKPYILEFIAGMRDVIAGEPVIVTACECD